MYIVYEKLEEHLLVPVINEEGTITAFADKEDAEIEKIYLQPDYDNELVVK